MTDPCPTCGRPPNPDGCGRYMRVLIGAMTSDAHWFNCERAGRLRSEADLQARTTALMEAEDRIVELQASHDREDRYRAALTHVANLTRHQETSPDTVGWVGREVQQVVAVALALTPDAPSGKEPPHA